MKSMKTMRKIHIVLALVLVSWAFVYGAGENVLLEKDRAISKASAENGILKAFYPFLTGESLLFPGNGFPVLGKETCGKLMNAVDMNGWEGKLTWTPETAIVCVSGEMGYTYGYFEMPNPDKASDKKTVTSLYNTIWKKDSQGNWKIMVSHGLILLKDLAKEPLVSKIDKVKQDAAAKAVIETELAFSAYSVEKGRMEAFYIFMDDKGANRGGNVPRTKEFYEKQMADEKGKRLEWEPFYAYVAKSGDLAYDYGPYKYTVINSKGNPESYYGYFITVWKKQPGKTWKFILDCGNECPGPTKK
jgi:ketosteroid isomerase-like protein